MTTLVARTTAQVFVDGPVERVPTVISWTPDEPLVVQVEFTHAGGEVVTWPVGRDVLIEGSNSFKWAGDYDVLVRMAGFHHLSFCFRGVITVMRRDKWDWLLAESVAVCPPGSECETAIINGCIDADLTELLEGP